jgi:hypothetical protein
MYLQFCYVSYKKEKKDYILVIKKENEDELDFKKLNNIIYNKLCIYSDNNQINDNININFNYFEYFYIKKGSIIKYSTELWSKLINIYIKKINILDLIDDNYINNIYKTNLLLYNLDDYKIDIITFLTDYYDTKFLNNC